MRNQIFIEKKEDYLYLTISGEYEKEEFFTYPKLVKEACEKAGIYKVLFNFWEVNLIKIEFLDRFHMGEEMAAVLGYRIKLAIVMNQKFYTGLAETVAFNRGANVRVFADVKTAELWLRL